jgi:hypothetical protein
MVDHRLVYTPAENARTRPPASVRARFAFPGLIWLALPFVLALACGGDDQQPDFDCPDMVPAHDAPCDEPNATCTYMDCTDVGVSTATCRTDKLWDIATAACGEVSCENETCAPGFICVVSIAGFPQGACVENPCGDGPIGCECPGCSNGDNGCSSYGLTLECNTCQASICP